MSISKSLELEERDWREIYYACDTKAQRIENGDYGEQTAEECAAWAAHLREIMTKIEGLGLIL